MFTDHETQTTRRSSPRDSSDASPRAESFVLYRATLDEARRAHARRKGKARAATREDLDDRDDEDDGEHPPRTAKSLATAAAAADDHLDRPPTYGEATTESRRSVTTTRRRRSTKSDAPSREPCRCSRAASASSRSTTSDDDDDALTDLVNLTTSLLRTSCDILSNSRALHSHVADFLRSPSPPSSSPSFPSISTPREIGLGGDPWDRLQRLERDVETFCDTHRARDPRELFTRRTSQSSPVVGLSVVETAGGIRGVVHDDAADAVTPAAVGLGRPSGPPTSSVERTAVVAGGNSSQRHARRSSAAHDLLKHISTSSSSSTAAATPRPVVSPSLPSLTASSSTSSLSYPSSPTSTRATSRPPNPSRPTWTASSTSSPPRPAVPLASSPPSPLGPRSASPANDATTATARRSSARRPSSTLSKSVSSVAASDLVDVDGPRPLAAGSAPLRQRGDLDEARGLGEERRGGAAVDRLRNLHGAPVRKDAAGDREAKWWNWG